MKTFNNSTILLFAVIPWMNPVTSFTTSSVRSIEKRKNLATRLHEKPGWLDNAMKGIPSEEFDAESYKKGITLQPGIAGFSVDPELGFVSILATNSENDADQRWIPAVVSPSDKDRPKSAEALTCVQLAGGLDLGTTILPPNTLAKLVADHKNEEEDTSVSGAGINDDAASSKRLSLTKITALPNPQANNDAKICNEADTQKIVATSPERDRAILDALPKLEKAVKSLPGLELSTTEDVTKAVQQFADPKGAVGRTAFTAILDALRKSNTPSTMLASPLFRLEVSIIDGGGISQADIDSTNAMVALGLSMRYKVAIDVGEFENHQEGGIGKVALVERFPAFRPIQELNEDSKIIDGFIPSMFEKARLDNDMKAE